MSKKEKIKAECDKLTAEFDKLYGQRHIIVGRTKGHTYMSIPDDPKEFGSLIERLLMGLAKANKPEHVEAFVKATQHFADFVQKKVNEQMTN